MLPCVPQHRFLMSGWSITVLKERFRQTWSRSVVFGSVDDIDVDGCPMLWSKHLGKIDELIYYSIKLNFGWSHFTIERTCAANKSLNSSVKMTLARLGKRFRVVEGQENKKMSTEVGMCPL